MFTFAILSPDEFFVLVVLVIEPFTGSLSTVLPCMLFDLHAIKVLFYAESVSVVTSGHVTKMAVTPFDPRWPKTFYYTRTLRLYLLYNRSYCRLIFYIIGIENFAFFCEKLLENVKFSIRTPKLMQMMPKHIFLCSCSSWAH